MMVSRVLDRIKAIATGHGDDVEEPEPQPVVIENSEDVPETSKSDTPKESETN